jgi:drug/metabolite transporter superfamily protein YnfA
VLASPALASSRTPARSRSETDTQLEGRVGRLAAADGFVATFQPDPHFGRILAAYGGVFVAGSLAWGMLLDGFRPDRWDLIGAGICLVGVAVIMYAPRT